MRKLATLAAAVLWVGAMVLLMLFQQRLDAVLFVATCAALAGGIVVGAYASKARPIALAASLLAAATGLAAAWVWMPLTQDHVGRYWMGVIVLPLALLGSGAFRRRPRATGTLQRVSDL